MTNQSANPKVTFPVIPGDACPKGTWAEIFNWLIKNYLNNGVVLGISQVTQEQLATIEAQQQAQQNEIDALQKEKRNGNAALSNGDQTVAVSFSSDMPDTDYYIIITPLDTGGAALTAFAWSIVASSQTTSGFSTRWTDVPATVDSFDWQVIQR